MTSTDEPVFRKHLRHFNVPGHVHFRTFSTFHRQAFLTNDLWRTWLAACVRSACAEEGWSLWAYVFMPEHVHLLVAPRREDYSVAAFLRAVKFPFARRPAAHLREAKAPLLAHLTVDARAGHGHCQVWQAGAGLRQEHLVLGLGWTEGTLLPRESGEEATRAGPRTMALVELRLVGARETRRGTACTG